MFTAEQRAMADRLEGYLGVRIYEVEDVSTISSERMRASVLKEHGRRSWYSRDGMSLYVYTANLADSDPYTLLKEVVEESVMQKGLDFIKADSLDDVLDRVWAVASADDRMSVAYANRLPISNINNLGRVASRSYLSSLNAKGYGRAKGDYEGIASIILDSLSRSGFDMIGDRYFVEEVSRALSTYNRYHPVAVCSLTRSSDISGNIRDMVEYGRSIPPKAVCSARVSFGRLSDTLRAATGFDDMEVTTSLTKMISDMRKYGITEEALSEEDIVGKIQNPVAVIGFTASVPKRGEDGRMLENAAGQPVFRKENRFCVLTDMKVRDPETGSLDNLCVTLPSSREVYVDGADSLVLRGFSPRNLDRVLRSVEEGELLYCDERMLRYVAREEMNLAGDGVKNRRPRIGAGPNALDRRKRLNYVTNVVKDFLSVKRDRMVSPVEKENSVVEGEFSDVRMRSTVYTGKLPSCNFRGNIRSMDLKSRLERCFTERDFTPKLYRLLERNHIRTGIDLIRHDCSFLSAKDRVAVGLYLDRLGISRADGAGRKEAGDEPVTQKTVYPYIVDNIVAYVVEDIPRPSDEDLVHFLSQFGFDRDSLSKLVEDSFERSCDEYEGLNEEDRKDIYQTVMGLVQPEAVLCEQVKHHLNGQSVFPQGIFYLSEDAFEASFLRDDVGGRSFIVNGKGEPMHDGYFLFNTQNRDLGYELRGNLLRGKVIDCGQVKDIEIDLATGRSKSVSLKV